MKNEPAKKKRRWWRIWLGVLLVAVAGLVVVLLNINTIARIQINKALDRYLVAGGKLEAVDIRLLKGRVALSGLILNSPPGFDSRPLLSLESMEVDVAPWALIKGRVAVEDLTVKGLSLIVVRDPKGCLSPLELVAAGGAGPAAKPEKDREKTPPPWSPVVHLNAVHLQDMAFHLIDHSMKNDWTASLRTDLVIEGLSLQHLWTLDVQVERFNLNLKDVKIDQLPGFSETPLLSVDSFKLASQGIDLGAARVTLSDVVLDTLVISVERNAGRDINLLKLAQSWLPASDDGKGEKPVPSKAPSSSSGPGFKMPTVVVDTVELKSISAQLLDTIEGHPWRAGFKGMDMQIAGVEAGEGTEEAVMLASLDLELKGIVVDQPPGFDADKLLSIKRFAIISEKTDRPGNELVIKQVQLEGLTSLVTMNRNGVTNLQVLQTALRGQDEKANVSREKPAADKKAASPALDLQSILFEQISLEGGPVIYRDEFFTEASLEASLDNIKLSIAQLHMFSDNIDVDPASVAMSFELSQPGDLPTAYFGSLANVGPIGYGVPMVNTQVHLVGLKLDTLGPLVPKTTRTALGASGLDGSMSMALNADAIDLKAAVLTDHGIKYKGLKVKGPLDEPVVEPGPIMTGVFNRISDGLVNLGKGGLKTGVNIAEGGIGVVKELGSGAVGAGVNLGKSLSSTTAGILTLDKEKVKDGAAGTTKGTLDITKDSVKGSGQAAGGSLKNSAADLKGEDRVQAWEQNIPSRYEASMKHAEKALAEMPYPPVTE